jgi:glutamate 5-kinase
MAARVGHGLGRHGLQDRRRADRDGAGAHLAIASGRVNHPAASATPGTAPCSSPRSAAPARKAWLAGGLTAKGTIHVDAGAAKALRSAARACSPAGATRIEGGSRGDLVAIAAPTAPLARGLAEYDAADAARSSASAARSWPTILGYAPRAALVHRSHMALL